MTGETFDIAVVGAGPGGSSAATFLAREGVNVLLLDKASRAWSVLTVPMTATSLGCGAAFRDANISLYSAASRGLRQPEFKAVFSEIGSSIAAENPKICPALRGLRRGAKASRS